MDSTYIVTMGDVTCAVALLKLCMHACLSVDTTLNNLATIELLLHAW